MTFKLVIFDCDGVLVESEKLGNNVLAEMLSVRGYRISGTEAEQRFRGMKMAQCLEILQRESGIELPETFETDLRQRMSSVFQSHLQPVDGARQLVESLRIPFCVASNGPTRKIEENLQTTNLYSHFEGKIFSAYAVNAWKPDPGLFLAAAEHFNAAPEDCIVVEDSIVGVSAALAANMTVLALNTTADNNFLVEATKVFTSLKAIHQYLEVMNLADK